ncbi:MAG: hypothetical protein ACM37W_25950 [Actinomycetota bacterium]
MTQHLTPAQVAIASPLAAIHRLLALYNSDRNTNEPGPQHGCDRRSLFFLTFSQIQFVAKLLRSYIV